MSRRVEIDAVLATYPGVKLTQTVGVPHETLGEIVVSCIVPHEGASIDEAAIRAFAARSWPATRCRAACCSSARTSSTLTGSDKVKAGALRELAAARIAASAPRS